MKKAAVTVAVVAATVATVTTTIATIVITIITIVIKAKRKRRKEIQEKQAPMHMNDNRFIKVNQVIRDIWIVH